MPPIPHKIIYYEHLIIFWSVLNKSAISPRDVLLLQRGFVGAVKLNQKSKIWGRYSYFPTPFKDPMTFAEHIEAIAIGYMLNHVLT